jgi:hypothetical protein
MKYFVITHKKLPWEIPFPHVEIGVDGHVPPDEKKGLAASEILSRTLDGETALGALRGMPVINHALESVADDEMVFVGSYRLFLGREMTANWLDCSLQQNAIITPEQLAISWERTVATSIPDDVDIMIPSPQLFAETILNQYSRLHHLDDLFFAVGCAIRANLLDPLLVPTLLSSGIMIPYGLFAAKKKFRYDFNDRLWWCIMKFYKEFYVPRTAYQRRVIDFVFERVTSMILMQRIVREELRCMSCRNIWVSPDGVYRPSV